MKNNETSEGLLILRQCCDCKCWLDEMSRKVSKVTREHIDYVISHGVCPECERKMEEELMECSFSDDL